MKNIKIIVDPDISVPLEDLFRGGYEAHAVPTIPDCWVIVVSEKKLISVAPSKLGGATYSRIICDNKCSD